MVREPNATRNKSPIESVLPMNDPVRRNDPGVLSELIADLPHFWAGGGGSSTIQ